MTTLFNVFGISEGKDDAHFREMARTASDAIEKALKSEPGDGAMAFDSRMGPCVALDMETLSGLGGLGGLKLRFLLMTVEHGSAAGASAAFFNPPKGGKPAAITLVFRAKGVSDPGKLTPDVWLSKFKKERARLFADRRSAFTHEFIHFLDFMRVSDPEVARRLMRSAASNATASDKAYYNDSIETNAFVQQALTKLENFLKAADPEKKQQLLGKGDRGFYEWAIGYFPKGFMDNLDEKNGRKIVKRVMQLRQDLLR